VCKLLIVLMEYCQQNSIKNNPAAKWIQHNFNPKNPKFIVRGSNSDTNTICFYSKNLKGFNFCFRYLISSDFRKQFRLNHIKLEKLVKESNSIWIRAPGIIQLIHINHLISKNKQIFSNKNFFLHLCAARVTFKALTIRPTPENFLRFFSGLVSLYLVNNIKKYNPEIFFTGTSTKKSFFLDKDARHIVDAVISESKDGAQKSKEIVFLGAVSKLEPFSKEIYFLDKMGFKLDVYGYYDTKKKLSINFLGYADPNKIPEILSKYKFCFCPSSIMTEGFPRVIVEAISSKCMILSNKSSTFAEDIKELDEVVLFDNDFLGAFNQLSKLYEKNKHYLPKTNLRKFTKICSLLET